MATRSPMLFSVLSLDESLWAVAKLSFLDVVYSGRGARASHFTADSYRKNSTRIFSAHWARFNAVSSMVQDFSTAGLPIDVAPKTVADLHTILGLAVNYMRRYQLTPADAEHLAIAETNARTFVTADRQLATVFQRGYSSSLNILHLT
ncbi:MAG: hypothetical protein Q8O40_17205 [Chloroflexota bacterium]|nr:hypothetical protein [Chloroflexota bacterium]